MSGYIHYGLAAMVGEDQGHVIVTVYNPDRRAYTTTTTIHLYRCIYAAITIRHRRGQGMSRCMAYARRKMQQINRG